MPNPGNLEAAIWLAWLVSWLAASVWSNRTSARPSRLRELPYRLITLLGCVLLIAHHHDSWHHPIADGIGLALTILGIGFAWWARLHLGRLWSASVTAKQEHRIVDTGPYALVRHPIYTGLLTSILGTALIQGDWRGWLGAGLVIWGCYLKARLEEGFLRRQLGAEAYNNYAARVPMLIPRFK